jgi:hypothetical protein
VSGPLHVPVALPPEKEPSVPIGQEDGTEPSGSFWTISVAVGFSRKALLRGVSWLVGWLVSDSS